MFGSSFRFRQKCQQLPGNLTYSHAGLHSDRLAGLLTRFPFNHYALILPEAAEGGSKPIAGAKVSINSGITKFFSKKTQKKI